MRNNNPFNFLLILLGLLCGGHTLPVHAAGVVTDCSQFGASNVPGTLGAALVGGGEITFACSGTIGVPLISITADTRIDATGQNVTLDGSNATPYMFAITTGIPRSELELKNLTLTQGGRIITNLGGKVTLIDCVVTGNTPSTGTIISNTNTQASAGRMSLLNTTISGNTAGSSVIHNDGEMILTNSVVSGNEPNSATIYSSGSSYDFNAALTLMDSVVSDNSTTGIQSSGQLTLIRSTVSGNRAKVSSGGIFNTGTMTLINSTVSRNYAPNFGGGIHNAYGSDSTITDSIISNNSAGNGAGGISNYGGRLAITNSTLSDNSARDGGGIYNFDSLLTITNRALLIILAKAESRDW